MNDDRSDANVVYAKALAGLPDALSAEMTDFDRHGIALAVEIPGRVSEVRVDFLKPLTKAEDIRPALDQTAQIRAGAALESARSQASP